MSSPYPPPGESGSSGETYHPQSQPLESPAEPSPQGAPTGQQPYAGQSHFGPQPAPYDAGGFAQQPGYGGPGGPNGPGGPGGPGGPSGAWGQPPQKSNKTAWIVGGAIVAVLAIVATVLIITLGGDDKDTKEANGKGGSPEPGSGGGSGAEMTCGPDDYGIKVDPETGDTVTCSGAGEASEGAAAEPAIKAFEGSWEVLAVIATIDGELLDGATSAPLGPGDSTWSEGAHLWYVGPSSYCSGGEGCTALVVDETWGTEYTFEVVEDSWEATGSIDITCDDGSTDSMNVSISIPLDDSDFLTGTMTTESAALCNGPAVTVVEDLTLVKE